jgi:hypothetical protein
VKEIYLDTNALEAILVAWYAARGFKGVRVYTHCSYDHDASATVEYAEAPDALDPHQ